MRRFLAALVFVLIIQDISLAKVLRFEITQREDILNGKSFGLAGSYEKISGIIHFSIDPQNPSNRIITDVDQVSLNKNGAIEFSSEFYFIKPKNPERGNGGLLFEVGNRGGKGLLSFFNFASSSYNPHSEEHFGDGFLMKEGLSLLWVGWQWDTPEIEGRMRMYPPTTQSPDGPLKGLVRSDFVVRTPTSFHSLADRNHVPYPVSDPNAPENILTVRDDVESEREIVPHENWGFGKVVNNEVVLDPGHVFLKDGFIPFKIYEVVYVSENPPLVGLGPAAIRDTISRLKSTGADELGIQKTSYDRAIAFGISQSGRFLRTFLYYGFNQDEQNVPVFDGVIAHVAGGGRGSFNHRFAQASRDAHPYINFFHPTDIFPFTDRAQTDPDTGIRDGILSSHNSSLLPKVFYTNSSYEYWGRSASLIHTSVDGEEDAKLMDTVRIYQFSGTQHGPTRFPPEVGIGQQPSNPMDFRWSMRALLVAMDRWANNETTPPNSSYGRIEDGSLVNPDNLNFPELPEVNNSTRVHKAYRADYGESFRTKGVVTQEPPKIGRPYPIMVPAVNSDGNEISGISLPEHSVPLATYTGWNLFNKKSGPTHVLSSMQGSYIPFPRTRAEQEESGDPRPSIEQRYPSREHYLGLVSEAALQLIQDGYLLSQDLPQILTNAKTHWNHVMAQ